MPKILPESKPGRSSPVLNKEKYPNLSRSLGIFHGWGRRV
jgi:hypothetical protein